MGEINNFPISTSVYGDLDPITDAQASDDDGILFFDQSVGVMKRMTRGELFKGKVIPLDSIASFPALDVSGYSDRQQFHLNSFAPNGETGGGPLLWSPVLPKSLHDGVRYFSPTVPIPADFDNPTDVQNYMDGIGEEFPTADGVFVLTLFSIQSSESPTINNALVQFDGVSGNTVKNGPVPSLIGTALIETPNVAEVSYHRLNADDTVTTRTTAQHKSDLSLNNVNNTSDVNKPISTATQAALDLKANTSDVNSALNLKAPLASPVFTGTPTVPTAISTTNTTQAASTAFVQTAVLDKVKTVPTFADLSTTVATEDGQQVMVGGRTTKGFDGSVWIWDASSTATASDIVVAVGGVATGRWLKNRRQSMLSLDNSGQSTGEQGVSTIYQRADCTLVGLDIFNFSGVEPDGSHDNTDGATSMVIHHYNDKDAVVWDYVGRGNTIHLLRMAHNDEASGHDETGSGYFARYERTVLYDSNYVAPSNRTLFGIKQVDLFDLGLSGTIDEWAILLHGRDQSKTSTIGQSYIGQPILVHTYGQSSNHGAAGLFCFSGTYGGSALKVQTSSTTDGNAIEVNHATAGEVAVQVNNAATGSSASFASVNTGSSTRDHFSVQTTIAPTGGFALKISDEAAVTKGGLSANGRSLFLWDNTSSVLRTIQVNGGVITHANKLPVYTIATLPDVAANIYCQIYVSDLSGGAEPCFSDGTNWRRGSDRTVAS